MEQDRLFMVLIEIADILHNAALTFWLSGITNCSAVQHQTVTKIIGTIGREHLTQELFDLDSIFCLMKSKPSRDPDTVCIDNNSRLSEDITDNKIGGLSADSG